MIKLNSCDITIECITKLSNFPGKDQFDHHDTIKFKASGSLYFKFILPVLTYSESTPFSDFLFVFYSILENPNVPPCASKSV